jgi:hypothetical protein
VTVYRKVDVDGTVSDYAALPIMENPEFVESLPSARVESDSMHFYCGYDAMGRLWVDRHPRPPTRDEMIASWMAIPCCTPTKDDRGWSVMGEKHYPTLEEAAGKVDRLYPDLIPTQTTEAAA